VSDKYDIPDGVFGEVPDDFYGLVGRVALLAALLDDRLLSMVWALRNEPQPVQAGQPSAELLRLATSGLLRHDDELRTAGEQLLAQTKEALDARNAIVHSIWPNPSLTNARGWRPVIQRRRTETGEWTQWIELDEAKLRELILSMVRLISDHDRLRTQIPYLEPDESIASHA